MKKNKFFQFAILAFCAMTFVFMTACEGPVGPVGPAGPEGPQGPAGAAGTDGTDGVSGSAECLTCHSSDAKYLVTQQYEGSGHASGSTVGYAGSRYDCAMCHSNEGFIETQWSGEDEAANDFSYPTRISCTTCHSWHNEAFDPASAPDYALRTTGAVDLYMYRVANLTAEEIDLGDNSNLCVNCHQPRRSWAGYVASEDNLGDGTFDQGSTHFGPHHGPQSSTMAMTGAADIGTTAFPASGSYHANNASCVTCHMNEQDHSFEPELDACNSTSCHNGNMTTLTDNQAQIDVRTKFDQLEDALITAGLLEVDPDDGSVGQVEGVYDIDHVGALFNYEWVLEDRSDGVHNFAYIEAILDKALEALQ